MSQLTETILEQNKNVTNKLKLVILQVWLQVIVILQVWLQVMVMLILTLVILQVRLQF